MGTAQYHKDEDEELASEAMEISDQAAWPITRTAAYKSAAFRRMVVEERSRKRLRSTEATLFSILSALGSVLLEGSLVPEDSLLRTLAYALLPILLAAFAVTKSAQSGKEWRMELLRLLFAHDGALTCDDGWPEHLDLSNRSTKMPEGRSAHGFWLSRASTLADFLPSRSDFAP